MAGHRVQHYVLDGQSGNLNVKVTSNRSSLQFYTCVKLLSMMLTGSTDCSSLLQPILLNHNVPFFVYHKQELG